MLKVLERDGSGTGLSVKAGGAGRYEPGFGEGNTKCKE